MFYQLEEVIEDEPLGKKCCSEYNREVESSNVVNNNIKALNVKSCIDSIEENIDNMDKGENIVNKCENNETAVVLEALHSE